MAPLVRTTIETFLGDDANLNLDGAGYPYASLSIGDSRIGIRILGGTGSRQSDLQRFRSVLAGALEAVVAAIGEEQQ